MTRPEYPWLLPSALADPVSSTDGERQPRRTARDWIVDISAFLIAAGIGILVLDTLSEANNSDLVTLADQVAGALGCCALWLRRRWPVGIAVGLVALNVIAPLVAGASLVALFGVAVHRSFKPVALIGIASVIGGGVGTWLRPDPTSGWLSATLIGALLTLLVIGWGMAVRSRRQLLVVLQERARRAEAEADLRAEQAQRLAREAIAREMHDVLAHRLTLLSVHAGALEFRPDAPPAEVARAAGVIRDSAHEALQDLREIIGVLRAPGEGDEHRPQPTLATLEALVAESRQAGMKVALELRVADPETVPAATGRTAYRIAQEGLTNARKHAPGTEVTVTVEGSRGNGLTVEVHNPAPVGDFEKVPGSGQGLIGLTERATLAGGRLDHGTTGEGGFLVGAWLPWPA
ncbi:histidine kinase [Streptomyces sp. NPDC050738]|uniref:sensor histidine kinase n=1 Tax=Streptomyces sp. NPDC050738 TaxID=3154744 RepID=UPI00341A45FC